MSTRSSMFSLPEPRHRCDEWTIDSGSISVLWDDGGFWYLDIDIDDPYYIEAPKAYKVLFCPCCGLKLEAP